MPVWIKVPDFLLNVFVGNIDMDGATFRLAFSNTAPGSQPTNPLLPGNGVRASVTEISYTNYGDTLATDRQLAGGTVALSATPPYPLVIDWPDFTVQPVGGTLATFRYVYIFAVRATAPIDPLVACGDLEEAVSLAAGEPYSFRFDPAGVLRLS